MQGKGMRGKGMPRRVCALCFTILTVPSVPHMQAGAVGLSPARPHPAHPGTSPGQDAGTLGCQG